MFDGLLERLGDVTRTFAHALVIGCPDTSARSAVEKQGLEVICVDPAARNAALAGGIQAEEDALPFVENSFDLVLACGAPG